MDIIKNILDREINDPDILEDMHHQYVDLASQGLEYCPEIARTIANHLELPLNTAKGIVEKYVYQEIAERYISLRKALKER